MNTLLTESGRNNDRYNKLLLERWDPLLSKTSGDERLKPITSTKQKLMVAQVLQNQEDHFKDTGYLKEANSTTDVFTGYGRANDPKFGTAEEPDPSAGGGAFPSNDDTYARGDTRVPGMIMPMIRRVLPELIANEIVGIQPMAQSVGIAFALRFNYSRDNLGDFSPDNTANANGAPGAWRSDGEEMGYQKLNTAHTGITSDSLTGLGVQGTATSGSGFDFIQDDTGVARLTKELECSSAIPQVELELQKTTVTAGTRKLAFKYSVELEQDLMNQHGISVDEELTQMVSYELQAEIDREIIMRMIALALNAGDGQGYSYWNPATADGRWGMEKYTNLYTNILNKANLIAVRNRVGPGNFIVATPQVVSILQSLPIFKAIDIGNDVTSEVGIARSGTLGGRFKVYQDTRTEAQFQAGLRNSRIDYILLGYKGSGYFQTGMIYCPYIPIFMQRTVGVTDFSPRVGLSTRYGLAENMHGADKYYHVIIIEGLTEQYASDGNTQILT